MWSQTSQRHKLPSTHDNKGNFACDFSVTFVTFVTFSICVTAKVTHNSLIISKCDVVTFVPVFSISSEIIFTELFLRDFDDFACFLFRI